MGIFGSGKANGKASRKVVRARKDELSTALKNAQKARKQEKKSAKKRGKELKSARKHETKMAKMNFKSAKAGKFDKDSAKRLLGVAQVLVPVILPLIYRGATSARGIAEQRRAHASGAPRTGLGATVGSGAALHARLEGINNSLAKISALHSDDSSTTAFVDQTRARLRDLAAATDTAETLPTTERKKTHSSISSEIDKVNKDVLAKLGV